MPFRVLNNDMGVAAIGEVFSGLIALLSVGGTILLALHGETIPSPLGAIDAGIVGAFFVSQTVKIVQAQAEKTQQQITQAHTETAQAIQQTVETLKSGNGKDK